MLSLRPQLVCIVLTGVLRSFNLLLAMLSDVLVGKREPGRAGKQKNMQFRCPGWPLQMPLMRQHSVMRLLWRC